MEPWIENVVGSYGSLLNFTHITFRPKLHEVMTKNISQRALGNCVNLAVQDIPNYIKLKALLLEHILLNIYSACRYFIPITLTLTLK